MKSEQELKNMLFHYQMCRDQEYNKFTGINHGDIDTPPKPLIKYDSNTEYYKYEGIVSLLEWILR